MPAFSEFDHQFSLLESELKRLEAEYNMFFAGRLPRLPWETRGRVEAMIKRLGQEGILNTGDTFRFDTLQSRFTKFCELWERTQHRREGGRVGPWRPRPQAPPPPPAPRPVSATPVASATRETARPATPATSPGSAPAPVAPPAAPVWADGRTHVTRLGGGAAGEAQVKALYEELRAARRATGEGEVAYERFEQLVRTQLASLGGASKDVAFRVAVRDGRVAFTARPVTGADDE